MRPNGASCEPGVPGPPAAWSRPTGQLAYRRLPYGWPVYALYSHGWPGAMLFVSFLGYALWRTRRAGSPVALWCHVVLVIAFVLLPFYGQIPTQLHIIMIAIALGARELSDPDREPTNSGCLCSMDASSGTTGGDGGFAWSCGFTQPYDADTADQWREALG